MNIVLIGYRGTGKSVVGELLAKRLGMPCIGMDASIVQRAGMSIPDIVEKFGWSKFRDLESEEARNLSGQDHIIIDTGGGVIERPENMEALKTNALVVWLKASVNIIVSRIQKDTKRPALTEGKSFTEEVEDVLAKRITKYQKAAQYEIDTDDLTPVQISDRIIAIWREQSP